MSSANFNLVGLALWLCLPITLSAQVVVGYTGHKLTVSNGAKEQVLSPPVTEQEKLPINVKWEGLDQPLTLTATTGVDLIVLGARVHLNEHESLTCLVKKETKSVQFTCTAGILTAVAKDDVHCLEQTSSRKALIKDVLNPPDPATPISSPVALMPAVVTPADIPTSQKVKMSTGSVKASDKVITVSTQPDLPPVAYVLGYGDRLTISAKGLTQDVHLDLGGRAPIMPLGLVRLSEYSPSQLNYALSQLFSEKYGEPTFVNVSVTTSQTPTIEITGAVLKPDLYRLHSGESSVTLKEVVDTVGNIDATDISNITLNHLDAVTRLSEGKDDTTRVYPGDSLFFHSTN